MPFDPAYAPNAVPPTNGGSCAYVCTCVVGGTTTFLAATDPIPYVGICILGLVAPGFGVVGARLSSKLTQKVLKRFFAVFLLFS
eukprot:gene4796-67286_t